MPNIFKEFYEDLSNISFLIKKEMRNMRTMSHTLDYAESALKYIDKKLRTVGQDNQHLGKTPEQPQCFFDGKRFFKAGLAGFAIVCRFRDQGIIIDPMGDCIYYYFNNDIYINGALVKKTTEPLELLTHQSYCNSLLLIFKQLGQTTAIQLDPQGTIQNLC
jgi:hypothetical protein